MKIAFVPIDNRPVCYTLPKIIAGIDEKIEFFIPQREDLGDLHKYANIENLFKWLENLPKLDDTVDSIAIAISFTRSPDALTYVNKN